MPRKYSLPSQALLVLTTFEAHILQGRAGEGCTDIHEEIVESTRSKYAAYLMCITVLSEHMISTWLLRGDELHAHGKTVRLNLPAGFILLALSFMYGETSTINQLLSFARK